MEYSISYESRDQRIEQLIDVLQRLRAGLQNYHDLEGVEKVWFWYINAPDGLKTKPPAYSSNDEELVKGVMEKLYQAEFERLRTFTANKLSEAPNKEVFIRARAKQLEQDLNDHAKYGKQLLEDVLINNYEGYADSFERLNDFVIAKAKSDHKLELSDKTTTNGKMTKKRVSKRSNQKIQLHLTQEQIGILIQLLVNSGVIKEDKTRIADLISKSCSSKGSEEIKETQLRKFLNPSQVSPASVKKVEKLLRDLKGSISSIENY